MGAGRVAYRGECAGSITSDCAPPPQSRHPSNHRDRRRPPDRAVCRWRGGAARGGADKLTSLRTYVSPRQLRTTRGSTRDRSGAWGPRAWLLARFTSRDICNERDSHRFAATRCALSFAEIGFAPLGQIAGAPVDARRSRVREGQNARFRHITSASPHNIGISA
jgi:hypothetical protein